MQIGYDILQKTAFPGSLPRYNVHCPAASIQLTWRALRNAYDSSEVEQYTGYVEVEDFLQDVQKPQIEALLYDYGADMLWCDIGMATVYPELGK